MYWLMANVFGNQGAPISGWFIPDGITLLGSALVDKYLAIYEIFYEYQAGAAFSILNATLLSIAPFTIPLFNAAALSIALILCSSQKVWWSTLLLLATPYYIVAVPLPSKDILVALLFVSAINLYTTKKPFYLSVALLISASIYFVRDGFGIILFVALFSSAIGERLKLSRPLIVSVIAIVSSLFWTLFESLFEGSFIYARAIGVAEQGSNLEVDSLPTVTSYLIRLFGTATNLAFRPIFFDTNGQLNILSIAYWISGLTLLYAVYCCLRALKSKSPLEISLGTIGVICLLLLSITPYVQPRYLLPICLLIPFFSFTSPKRFLVGILCIVFISLVAAAIYAYTGNYPPNAEPIYFTT